ncbi:MAG: hypothetical protein DSZ29_03080 [Aquificaceae bacterium]|nr:MAG: hypothetical protein DSZ29_03080 [Aquificaceae bacterium]
MSKDNDVTTLQEYIISGIVIAFFGLLYFYLSGSFLSDEKKNPSVATSSQGYALTSLGSSDADKLSLQSETKTTSSSNNSPTITPPSTSADTKQLASQTASAEIPAEPVQAKEQIKEASKENINVEAMDAQADMPSKATPKIDEVKQQLATATTAEAVKEAQPQSQPKDTKPQEEAVPDGLIFELPSGQKVEIPAEGFENKLKTAIVKGDRNTPIIFDRVYFDTGSKNLSAESAYQISSTAAILNTYKDVNITIRGHSDNRGSSKKNAQLSLFRSGSMKKALVKLGIDPKRIHIEGLGEVDPIDTNKTPRGRRNNRRIDLIIR